jgi:segregation and condensation protein A
MEYQVKLDTFQGPLDLLLYLVKRDEIDIRDIPIAKVAEQFIDYLRVIEVLDVDAAGDFLVVAATLMEIKSRMLLPRGELPVEEDDPREDLVRQLMEYKKYKEAAALLEAQADRQQTRFARIAADETPALDPAQQPLRAVELWDLVSAFGRLMRETLALQPQQIVVDETPMHAHQERILGLLAVRQAVDFADVFSPPRTRSRLVGIFLALLELMKGGQIVAEQDAACGAIELRRAVPVEPPA